MIGTCADLVSIYAFYQVSVKSIAFNESRSHCQDLEISRREYL